MTKPNEPEALIYLMVIMSAVDRDMGDAELARIGAIVHTLPVFADFAEESVLETARDCQKLLQDEGGFEAVLKLIRDALTPPLRETAYALAVDVAAVDLDLRNEESRMLDIVRSRFGIDALAAAAIERAAAIRHRTA